MDLSYNKLKTLKYHQLRDAVDTIIAILIQKHDYGRGNNLDNQEQLRDAANIIGNIPPPTPPTPPTPSNNTGEESNGGRRRRRKRKKTRKKKRSSKKRY